MTEPTENPFIVPDDPEGTAIQLDAVFALLQEYPHGLLAVEDDQISGIHAWARIPSGRTWNRE